MLSALRRVATSNTHIVAGLFYAGLSLTILVPAVADFERTLIGFGWIFIIFVDVIPITGWVLRRKIWLTAPLLGLAATALSLLYTTSIHYSGLCAGTHTSLGPPYTLFDQYTRDPGSSCPPLGSVNGISRNLIEPNYPSFYLDFTFYTTLAIACIEFYTVLHHAIARKPPTVTEAPTESSLLKP